MGLKTHKALGKKQSAGGADYGLRTQKCAGASAKCSFCAAHLGLQMQGASAMGSEPLDRIEKRTGHRNGVLRLLTKPISSKRRALSVICEFRTAKLYRTSSLL